MTKIRVAIIVAVFGFCSAKGGAAASEPGPSTLTYCANPHLPSFITGQPTGQFEPLNETLVATPHQRLTLAIAITEPDIELGLMCVLRLPPHTGMIFVFSDSRSRVFWMKNTLIPLDMIWLDDRGLVTSVYRNVPASTRTERDSNVARRSGRGKFVIELAAGEAANDGIVKGAHLFSAPNSKR